MEHFAQTNVFARVSTVFARISTIFVHLIIGCAIQYPKTGNLRYIYQIHLVSVVYILHIAAHMYGTV